MASDDLPLTFIKKEKTDHGKYQDKLSEMLLGT
jgi:hypothetical protein